jgi:hypothetical protein
MFYTAENALEMSSWRIHADSHKPRDDTDRVPGFGRPDREGARVPHFYSRCSVTRDQAVGGTCAGALTRMGVPRAAALQGWKWFVSSSRLASFLFLEAWVAYPPQQQLLRILGGSLPPLNAG